MNKKIGAFLFVLFLTLTSCTFLNNSSDHSESSSDFPSSSGGSSSQSSSSSSSSATLSSTSNISSSTTSNTTSNTTSSTNDDVVYTINNQVLVDNEFCVVTVVEAYNDEIWGFTLRVLVENKTSDKNIMFSIETAAIMGYEIDPFWAKEVSAGNQAYSKIQFSNSKIEELGITAVDEIKLYMRAYDSDDWMADDYFEDVFTVYPTGLSSEEIVSPSRPTYENEYVVVDNEYCTFVIISAFTDSIWGYSLNYYIENKTTDIELMFTWDDVSVNGFMIEPYWASSIQSGNKQIGTISFSESSFNENFISIVTMIEFELNVYDNNDYFADNFVEEVFQYTPAN